MDFDEVLAQVQEQLAREKRIAYRILKRRFQLNDEDIEDLKADLIDAKELAIDKDGKVLVWAGGETPEETSSQLVDAPTPERPSAAPSPQLEPEAPTGERRQLTVMFCDLVGSTALSEQLDPEELQTVVRTYQEVSAQVIERYEGYIAQYLGDGLLVYFGYPAAHEDDAARAIRAGLEIVTALQQARSQFPQPVQVRIGIHTGPVVVGQIGGGSRHEQLALGETPNIAARVQGQAEPDEVVISAATQRLVAGLFQTEDRGLSELKGIAAPQALYRITTQNPVQSRFEVSVRGGLTPLVGHDHELGALHERWTQAQAGNGQAVLVSGEPGIGKSRLMQELRERVVSEGATHITFQCSPYHQNSALYPITEHLQRLLEFTSDDTPQTKLDRLEQLLGRYRFPQPDTLALFAALLSLPQPEGIPPSTVSPQQQKEQTQAGLVAWLVEEAENQVVYNAWEDLHWADPSSLELLGVLLTQVPTTRLLAVLTYRPEFTPSWGTHSYISQLSLSRLGRPQVERMVAQVTGGKTLPDEVLEQIATKTDGVPLFVEELTKMVLESDFVREENGHYELTGPLPPLAIPSTLQDSLMARLDRLAAVKEVAQLGATIGREFSYELLQAISPLDEAALQHALQQLVEAELVFQRGLLPQARYVFKHALIQDTAYASLLKSRRQQLHQQVAQVLVDRFPKMAEVQPELVAHHYTEVGLGEQALPHWHAAGQRAMERSAHEEAIQHLTTALEILPTLPPSPEHLQLELVLQTMLAVPLMVTRGWAIPEVKQAFSRAYELSQQIEETPELFPVLLGLAAYYANRAEYQTGQGVAQQCLRLAQRVQDTGFLLLAEYISGAYALQLGEFAQTREWSEHVVQLYDPTQHGALGFRFGIDPGGACGLYAAFSAWYLGYPDHALSMGQGALTLVRNSSYPPMRRGGILLSLVYLARGEARLAQELAERTLAETTEEDLIFLSQWAKIFGGFALAEQGRGEEGLVLWQQGWNDLQATGSRILNSVFLLLKVRIYARLGQVQDGLRVLDEVQDFVEETGETIEEAELHRLKGELLLSNDERGTMNDEWGTGEAGGLSQAVEAEACFYKAIEVSRHQQAKSLELRAATSLARLWQQQAKTEDARQLLAEMYGWFTEGFDTADLRDAKALLEELS